MGGEDFDIRAILRHITPRNVALWVLVLGWAAFSLIVLIWLAVYLWGTT